MVLAKDVIDEQGRVLINGGSILSEDKIRLLEKHQVVSVFVAEAEAETTMNHEITVVQDLISTATRLKLIYGIKNAFYAKEGIAQHLAHLRSGVEDIVEDLLQRPDALIYLTDIRVKSDYLFMHSVNVGLFSIIIGMQMKLSKPDLVILGLGGLLHDFGKTRIAQVILDKEGPLSPDEFRQVKEHSAIGFSLLKVEAQVDHRIYLMALQHHERCDGRGYPWGISRDEIHPFARVVAVADVYDALTTDRVYRRRIQPFQAMAMMNEGVGTQFDPDVIAAFNRVAVPFNIGTCVRLNNGFCGRVVRINSVDPVRPVIMTDEGLINLYTDNDIAVMEVI